MSALTFWGEVDEDGGFSALNRITSLSASGEEMLPGEGPVVKVADVSSITCKVFDLGTDRDADTDSTPAPSAVNPDPTVTAAANVFDTLRTAGWREDLVGYNFRLDLGGTYFDTQGEWRLAEIKVTLTGGEVIWIEWRIKIKGKATS